MVSIHQTNEPGRHMADGLIFFPGNWQMAQVRRWAVRWNSEDDKLCLIGDYDFAADLCAALNKSTLVPYVDLWPCVARKTGVTVYSMAIHTIQRFKRDNDLWRHWSGICDENDFDFPDVWDLFDLNRAGVRKNVKRGQ